ncbi:MAG: HAMP domain-containing histidine kinase [Elusimicrobiota bacterium]|jgi:signal transduction histidine kinase|nr:HAMP domain-containing histidine kinase [Elusimicrobiota bacterium]
MTDNQNDKNDIDHKDPATRVLSLISHKLKTPLSIINGYTEAILSQTKPGELSSFASKALLDINKQGEKLSVIVDKLVRFSSVSSLTKSAVKKDMMKVRPVFSSVSGKCIMRDDSLNVMSSDMTIRFQGPAVEIKCDTDTEIYADKALVSIAIEDLMDNAIKFKNNAPKKIRLFYYGEEDMDVLAVADNGVGIKEEHINRIFEKFYQVDDFFTGQIEGWGLGLALVKRIMSLHGGTISVRSQYGVGTIISLRFPKRAAVQKQA